MQGDLETGHWGVQYDNNGMESRAWIPDVLPGLTVTRGDPAKGVYYATDIVGREFAIDPETNIKTEQYVPPDPTTYDPNSLSTNFQGYKYFSTPPTDSYNAQTYYIDPSTNKPVRYDEWGSQPFLLTDPRTRGSNGFDNFITNNGWMIPLAMIGAGAGAALGGAAAAGEGAIDSSAVAAGGSGGGGAFIPTAGSSFAIDPLATYGVAGAAGDVASSLGTATELAGPTYGELGVTGLPEGAAGPTYGEMGYTGLNQQAAIDAANAASAAQGTSLADALKTANQVKQGVSTASSLAKLLSPTSALSGAAGSALSGAAQNLATGQTGVGSAIPALVRGNQNPFLQTAQQPIRSSSPDLAQLANLLKQG